MLHVFSKPSEAQRPLRIGFLDVMGWDFHALTPDTAPLGGSQSAACYLARALAARGQQVFLLTNVREPGLYGGVQCLSLLQLDEAAIKALRLDVCVVMLTAGNGMKIRQLMNPETRLVFWAQHAADQAGVQALRNRSEMEAYDRYAMVSQWQAEGYAGAFGVPRERMAILPNAAGAAFENLYPAGAGILAGKAVPPVLAYTSTPFRGLDLLLEAFPRIRAAIPGARLRVYSSLKVYRVSAEKDQAQHGELYELCRRTEGVEHVGSVGQGELARQLREASFLAYPNTFPETYCIAALEALAAGCRVVSSRLGALPETTAGFAELLDLGGSKADYLARFVEAVVAEHRRMRERPGDVEAALRRQVDYVNREGTWAVRARQWEEWLGRMCGGG